MKKNSRLFFVLLCCVGVCAGFLVPFWPLSVVSAVLLAFFGSTALALILVLILDIAYGVPTGVLHLVLFPCTLLVLGVVCVRLFSKRFFLQRGIQERL